MSSLGGPTPKKKYLAGTILIQLMMLLDASMMTCTFGRGQFQSKLISTFQGGHVQFQVLVAMLTMLFSTTNSNLQLGLTS